MKIAVLYYPTTSVEILDVPDGTQDIEGLLEEEYGLDNINYMTADNLTVRHLTQEADGSFKEQKND